MCGKFRAMRSWREIWELYNLTPTTSNAQGNDEAVIYRVMGEVTLILWDEASRSRRIAPTRWAFPQKKDPRRPDLIHARAETIDEKGAFRDAFLSGQRGIVAVTTFNEGRDLPNGKTEQWTINPNDGRAHGIAFVWKQFETMTACVMVTVAASELIAPITDRMPAVLADEDWAKWLGEEKAEPAEIKSLLQTRNGPGWTIEREAR